MSFVLHRSKPKTNRQTANEIYTFGLVAKLNISLHSDI